MSDVWEPPVWRKELIDAVAPDNPVYIIRYTHGSAANRDAWQKFFESQDSTDRFLPYQSFKLRPSQQKIWQKTGRNGRRFLN